MFGGYTEVAAYYVDMDGTSENKALPDVLPSQFLPKDYQPDPWHRTAACQRDFILIAEFCEQEGPKPLITIPTDSGAAFDLNEFAVRIMSVDHQTFTSGLFSLTEDHELVMSEEKHGLQVYVHHFILHDSQARGFVRPFCMSYVTPDQSKLMAFHDAVKSEFSEVSRYLKFGNMKLFTQDMTHYFSDLLYTQDRIREKAIADSHRSFGSSNLDVASRLDDEVSCMNEAAIGKLLDEVRCVLQLISTLPTDAALERRFTQLEEAGLREEEEEEEERGGVRCPLRPPPRESLSSSLREGSHSLMNRLRGRNSSKRSRSFSDMEDTSRCRSSASTDFYQPKLVSVGCRRRFDQSLRSLHELCQRGAKEGLHRLRRIHTFFSRSMANLLIERNESTFIDPISSLLVIGGTFVLSFTHALNYCTEPSSPIFSTGHLTTSSSTDTFYSCQSQLVSPMDSIAVEEAVKNGMQFADDVQFPDADIEDSSLMKKLHTVKDGIDARYVPSCPFITTAEHVSTFSNASIGWGVQSLLQRYTFSVHLLYALLRGRPVLVVGSVKLRPQLEALCNTLHLFIATQHSKPTRWFVRPVRITDLPLLQLAAVERPDRKSVDDMVPSSVKRYVTVLDIDRQTLYSPPYLGGVITDIYNKRKSFDRESTFVAYIHRVIFELALKAFVYYHSYCAKSSDTGTAREQMAKDLKLTTQDAHIIDHLANVVIHQQVSCDNSELQSNDVQSTKLDYAESIFFKE